MKGREGIKIWEQNEGVGEERSRQRKSAGVRCEEKRRIREKEIRTYRGSRRSRG